MALGTANVPRKTSHFVTSAEFEKFQETYQSTYESAKAAGYEGTEEEFWAAFNKLIVNGGNSGNGGDGVSVEVITRTVSLTTEWAEQEDGTFAQTVSVDGVTGDPEQPIWVDCSLTREDIEADIAVLEAWKCINTVEPGEGSLTFYCYGDTPTVAIPTNVVVM